MVKGTKGRLPRVDPSPVDTHPACTDVSMTRRFAAARGSLQGGGEPQGEARRTDFWCDIKHFVRDGAGQFGLNKSTSIEKK